ncbi:MAG: efflux transporter periplasmic adaptor subunit [Acidocella sp. 20-57-95]|nr:MAG: efflux transporter periplasmic adaptor subunit [Acidocella sp. 20-57-95]OYV57878.1 MAG: efflux transporter periplasmic adaptor subunit [Acidocella sp. 21-58-7]HQT63834.1 efflux RND transporter periplasmic adaptor subunit [Acidocella sp.]HQU05449.1 efflux RND transporter periplasmic adaptor subunit [Acidocella sp.]
MRVFRLTAWLVVCAWATMAQAQPTPESFTISAVPITDQKAVFATVESAHVVPARARIGGTVTTLTVQDGDIVTAGEVIAIVADPTLVHQLHALDAEISGLKAQLAQSDIDLARAQSLIKNGAISRASLDQAKTAVNVAASGLMAKTAAREALNQQIGEGTVLAPVSGRVLLTPVTQGSVLMSGDTVASIAAQDYVLRLDVPEYHANFLHLGDPVRLDPADRQASPATFGKITLIYPQIQNGKVEADATAAGLGTYFVGQRIQVWVNAGVRDGIVIPARYIETRFGLDYVDLRTGDGSRVAVPVQRGAPQPTPAMPDGIEILSGLHPGDVVLLPGVTSP